ncbi:hypothetical protein [Mesorhizobium sp. 113-3-9]|nr:hypothetical protein [Mesorhizobium sp. 113-3-9]
MTKSLSPFEEGRNLWDKIRFAAWETTPAAGGGAAGAVLVVNPWEEGKG